MGATASNWFWNVQNPATGRKTENSDVSCLELYGWSHQMTGLRFNSTQRNSFVFVELLRVALLGLSVLKKTSFTKPVTYVVIGRGPPVEKSKVRICEMPKALRGGGWGGGLSTRCLESSLAPPAANEFYGFCMQSITWKWTRNAFYFNYNVQADSRKEQLINSLFRSSNDSLWNHWLH